jgi:peptide/nickel transport system substrate-binding protein
MGKAKTGLRAVGVLAAGALALSACGGGSSGNANASASGGGGQKGGTLTFLTQQSQILHLDPQRNYTGEDLAFAGGYLQRSLTAFKLSSDDNTASQLVPDLATDTGTATNDGKTWAFTLKDGVKFQDGTPITCADVKYGVSRTFATDVITDGPTYAISYLDIPTAADGSSVYKGPYTTKNNDTAAFDKAVTCSSDNKTITFNLNAPHADFNYTVTLLAFSPVPKAADTGEKYDDNPVSSGPYKIQTYTKGQDLILVRNDQWSGTEDTYRAALPDEIDVKFGLDAQVINQRMIADASADQTALTLGDAVQPASLAQVFNSPQYADRRFDGYDPYSRYIAINTTKVTNVKQRQAIMVALDRKAWQTINGGTFAGDLADGTIKPNIGQDYAPTGVWTGLLGQPIPDNGDPAYAKQLIQESGAPMPTLTYDYPQTPTHDKEAGLLVTSLKAAGITVKPNPIESGAYYGVVLDPKKQHELTWGGWGPDWPNASTVIPELFTNKGGFPLSRYDNADFNAKVKAALAEPDRSKQATMWQELNTETMSQGLVVPTLFGKTQRLVGSKVGGAYFWGPYGSWPYASLYVKQ